MYHYPELEAFAFQPEDPDTTYKAPPSRLLEKALTDAAIEYEYQTENSPNSADPMKHEILDAVKRWYQYDWLAIENKHVVVPAQAGTQVRWIPACAGMTGRFGFRSRWIPAYAGMTRFGE